MDCIRCGGYLLITEDIDACLCEKCEEFLDKLPPPTPEERLASLKEVVEKHTWKMIDGSVVDPLSASVILAVYDKLNPVNQQKYIAYNVRRMVSLAWRLA